MIAHRSSIVRRLVAAVGIFLLAGAAPALAQSSVSYLVSVPAPEHHWMQVEVRFPDVPRGTLRVMMSRSSPGRYALHDFARNVYDVQIDDGAGKPLTAAQANPSEWDVAGHAGTVRVRYRVFGNTTEGTFLSVDSTHAHFNIPAALMWARGLEERSVRITFEPPPGSGWQAASQLHPTADPNTFTAPNLSYLIDSPVEFGRFVLRTFQMGGETFRVALHHEGTDREADRLAQDVEHIAREEMAVFGELPAYEGGTYTFLMDLLPADNWDGMEHRNSTFITSPAALRAPGERPGILGAVSHEFFHSWNVERIRPRSIEPFNLEGANISGELWFAEGFTQYYGTLLLHRAGFANLDQTAGAWGGSLDTVIRSPARKYRSAEDMSRMAAIVDEGFTFDEPDLENTYISYYVWGEAIALGLDLSLRTRSGGAITLDHYMRAMWVKYGKPAGPVEGVVSHPYTMQDARDCLAEVSGDRAFADHFFDRYVQGREVLDYETLLGKAGLVLRKRNPRRAWIGPLALKFDTRSARVASPTIEDTPVYAAGLDEDDELLMLDGEALVSLARLDEIVQRHKPGDTLHARIRRGGLTMDLVITVQEDPGLELVPAERSRALTPSERALRDAWLGSKQ
jgi:predicted metalloprotease with PDZ domain